MTPQHTVAAPHHWLARLGRGTEMGDLVRSFDWTSTSLGHPDTWSHSLRAVVGTCLSSRFPMLVVWGPDLVKIYNDGYRAILGTEKHPRALGARTRDMWPEIWDTIGPMFEAVVTTGTPTWSEDQCLMIDRDGYVEECYFTYSYGPIYDDDGTIGGVLDVVQETTERVLAQRRLDCLTQLTAALVTAEHSSDVYRQTTSILRRWRSDIVAADMYQRIDGDHVLVSTNRRPGTSTTDPGLVLAAAASDTPVVVGDAPRDDRPAERFVTSIGDGFGTPQGVLSIALSDERPFDTDYRRFVELIAQVVGTALDSAHRRSTEVGQERQLKDALETALLQPASDFVSVAARYLPADGNLAVGGDWYDIIDLGEDRRGLVVGDCVGHGLDAAAVMAQLRSVSRAMLIDGDGPAEALVALDRLAGTIPGALGTTAVIAVIDRRARTVTYSRAGHIPPLLCRDGHGVWLDGAGGPPLAVDTGTPRPEVTMELTDDSALLLYTDGLVERRGESLDVGMQRLADVVLRPEAPTLPQQLADHVLAEMLPGEIHDDVVLVVKQLLVDAPTRTSDMALSHH